MNRTYEIPRQEGAGLDVGQWVEIFDASLNGDGTILVRSMRVEGRALSFGKGAPPGDGRPLRPHEGEIVFVDHDEDRTRFGIRLRT
jgi:hypothetical protein